MRAGEDRVTQGLLGVIAVVVGVTALEVTSPVVLPLVLALFLIGVFWPLQRRFETLTSSYTMAVALTLVSFLLIAGLFVGSFWVSAEIVAAKAPAYGGEFRRLLELAEAWWEDQHLLLFGARVEGADVTTLISGLQNLLVAISGGVLSFIIASLLVVTFLVLGMLEVGNFRAKVARAFGPRASARWASAVRRIIANLHRYIVLRTVVGLIAGILAGLFSWAIGLELAFIWGLVSFLFKYVPTVGPAVATLPPALFALVQFGSIEMVLLVMLGIAVIQFITGNYIDPLLQGSYLSISPVIVFLSLVFWGWLWGVVGAFISVPLTISILIACEEFDRTRWVAVLLLRSRSPAPGEAAPAQAAEGGDARR